MIRFGGGISAGPQSLPDFHLSDHASLRWLPGGDALRQASAHRQPLTTLTPIDRRQTRPYTAPPSCPGGGIGRRGGFKIRFRKEWEFESPPGHHESKPARHWSCGLFRFYRNNAGNCCKQVAGKLFQPLGKPRKTWPATLPAGVGNCAKLSVE